MVPAALVRNFPRMVTAKAVDVPAVSMLTADVTTASVNACDGVPGVVGGRIVDTHNLRPSTQQRRRSCTEEVEPGVAGAGRHSGNEKQTLEHVGCLSLDGEFVVASCENGL
jgi:hypothetical protein